MDPLSDILSLLNPRGSVSAGFRAGGDWALRLPAPDGVKFYAVVEGGCWLAVDGQPPARLRSGDCFLTSKSLPDP
ncbi:cupin domain-containing protein, partial [Inquilinus sp. CA228]|uniref:cupin domain-containing protein n=1 Tax=Inquilinus sp. CA228 TaxID=3455609 RepID=UPI003F8D6854